MLSYIKPVITPLEVSHTLVRAFSVRMLVSPSYQTPLMKGACGIIAYIKLFLGRDPILANQICQLLYDVSLNLETWH